MLARKKKPLRRRHRLSFVTTRILIALFLLKSVDSMFEKYLLPSKTGANTVEEFKKKEPYYLNRFPGTGSEGNWPEYRYLSWAGWAHEDQKNKYINIVGGFRTSYEPSCEGIARKKTAWFFGGSTMIGLGSMEDFTIPALTCKELQAKDPGTCWRCFNFGMAGYVNSQEIILFYRLLKEASLGMRDRPDLLVFYDGGNELFAAVEGAPLEHRYFASVVKQMRNPESLSFWYWVKGLSDALSRLTVNFFAENILAYFSPSASKPDQPAEKVASLLEVSARQYAFNYRVMSHLASAEGIHVLFLLSPSLFDKKPLSEYERWNVGRGNMKGLRFDGELGALWNQLVALIGRQPLKPTRNTRYLNLQDSFVGASESIFLFPNDWMHMNWYGNTLIARRVAEQILIFK